MMSNKLAVKCGNFAVLVDLHVLPQGTSKDSSWFSDHEKEEVCLLLKDTIDTRVKHHIESRRQQGQVKNKEYTQTSPLFLKGTRLRIAAYFIKRWVNLRCVVQHQYRELHVFPDRIVVCVSQLEPHSNTWAAETIKPSSLKESSSGRSEYFAERSECQINNILSVMLKKQAVLKNIVKKTKATKDSSPESGRDCKACPRLGLADSDKGSKINAQSEPQCRSLDQAEDCVNTRQDNLELPDAKVENDVNSRQPCRTSSQHKPQSAEWLQAQDPTNALSWICESALPVEKQTPRTSIMQQKRRRHSSEGNSTFSCKKADLRDDTFIRPTEKPVEPLSSRSLNLQTSSAGDPGASVEQTAVPVKHYAVSGDNKSLNSTREEKNHDKGRKPPDGQTRKLKLQRPKKLH
ncbi:protein SLX4IP isoform X1 [Bufo bufo]|uniref:protein SLX4IP isoform X1 n=1 Tax=Bufo bufo TaxID=8384 RepID=UPI001ABE8174|nr:protein SLX4IP isoform X1 [Bufo bufo]XP_040285831.1 protein SLX4IP isoform X1 [Bufo bufo]